MKNRILALLALLSVSAAEPVYDVIDLGTLGGWSIAISINNNGQIVGYAYNNQQRSRATLFDSTGTGNNIDLGTLGHDESLAFSINNKGQIVGTARNASAQMHGTLFDSTGDGNNIDLGTLGGKYSQANSINDNGQIVGYSRNASGERTATLFDSTGDGNNIDLGTLGGNRSVANLINKNRQIVGTARNAWGYFRATLFDSTGDGNNIDLGTLGGNQSYAQSINDNGQIVGEAENASTDLHATLFDSTGNGSNIDLGTLPGCNYSWAMSINNNGQIVGMAEDSSYRNWAVLFDSTGGGNNIDLNTLIDPASGWKLSTANYINDNGWIVGNGNNPDGAARAFLLKPVNTAPVAIAGPNQTIYTCSDATVDVNLDGSGSYDDDGDQLNYYWSWLIDGNLVEANGVSPTIQLPVGEDEIELIVDDGIDESEPDYCTVKVIEPLKAQLRITPRTLNVKSKGRSIKALVFLPEVQPSDIADEPLELYPGGIEAQSQAIRAKHGQAIILCTFDRRALIDTLLEDDDEITVVGRLTTGQCFYGTDTLRIIHR